MSDVDTISGASAKEHDDESSPKVLDPTSLAIMVHALKQNEEATGLSDSQIEAICLDAFADDQLNNRDWLLERIKMIKEGKIDLNKVAPENENDGEQKKKDSIHFVEISDPVRIESPEDLKEVIRLHEIWMNSVLDPRKQITGGRAHLVHANLSGYNLEGVNLSCANLKGAKLINANLTGANLARANLSEADLTGALLKDCKLKGTKLHGATLENLNLDGVDLSKAEIAPIILKNLLQQNDTESSDEGDQEKTTSDSNEIDTKSEPQLS